MRERRRADAGRASHVPAAVRAAPRSRQVVAAAPGLMLKSNVLRAIEAGAHVLQIPHGANEQAPDDDEQNGQRRPARPPGRPSGARGAATRTCRVWTPVNRRRCRLAIVLSAGTTPKSALHIPATTAVKANTRQPMRRSNASLDDPLSAGSSAVATESAIAAVRHAAERRERRTLSVSSRLCTSRPRDAPIAVTQGDFPSAHRAADEQQVRDVRARHDEHHRDDRGHDAQRASAVTQRVLLPCAPGRISNRGSSCAASVRLAVGRGSLQHAVERRLQRVGGHAGSSRAMTSTHQCDAELHWPRASSACRTAIGSEIDGDSRPPCRESRWASPRRW